MQYIKGKLSPVAVMEVSDNAKTGPVSATYSAQKTCPTSCPFRKNGCYAESGPAGFTTGRLNRNSEDYSLEELAHMEASGITQLSGKLPLRIHVVGDATTDKVASILADAGEYHSSKYGQSVWSYTHAWRDVSRESWGSVSIMASTECARDAKLAMSKGFAAAIVVNEHVSDKAYSLEGIKVIPCPQQTGKAANCASCKLCMRDKTLLSSKSVIAFAVHGSSAKKASAALNILQ